MYLLIAIGSYMVSLEIVCIGECSNVFDEVFYWNEPKMHTGLPRTYPQKNIVTPLGGACHSDLCREHTYVDTHLSDRPFRLDMVERSLMWAM